jgi:hypothetical protein
VLKADAPAVKALVSLFPTQGNEFGFVIFKTGQLRDWLELRDRQLRVSREKANERGQAYTLDKHTKRQPLSKRASSRASDQARNRATLSGSFRCVGEHCRPKAR